MTLLLLTAVGCDTNSTPVTIDYATADTKPEPVNGWVNLGNNGQYPEMAERAGIEGTVVVSLVISDEGEPFMLRIQEGIGGGCDEASLEVIRDEVFAPGRLADEAVNVSMRMGVTFSLADTSLTAVPPQSL